MKQSLRAILAIIAISIPTAMQSQCDPIDWSGQLKKDVEQLLQDFQVCEAPVDTPCNYFLARALHRVYQISDFDTNDAASPYMTANQIADYVMADSKWVKLGEASDQATLTQAQGYANCKKAVIAVQSNATGHGHVALILPGNLSGSGLWSLSVPNSASFILGRPDKSYIGKPLSYGFQSPNGVQIYGRTSP